jgi:RES domain-containing protein
VVYRPELLDALERLEPQPFAERAWRHMFNDHPPDVENTRGARWNPPGVAAVYLSLTREGAIAEGDHVIAIQPLRPRARRYLYPVDVTLENVIDLSDREQLADVGIGMAELEGDDLGPCQQVGGAVAWLQHDGLLVPSARSDAVNLVIFPANRSPHARFEFDPTAREQLTTS